VFEPLAPSSQFVAGVVLAVDGVAVTRHALLAVLSLLVGRVDVDRAINSNTSTADGFMCGYIRIYFL
jgi:hypothetical protein